MALPSRGAKSAGLRNDPNTAFDVLKASNDELRRLAGSKWPDVTYRGDFMFADEKKILERREPVYVQTASCT